MNEAIAAMAALTLMALLRLKVYHRLRYEVFKFSGERLSTYGTFNRSLCYFFICCAGFILFQILRGSLL